MQCQGHGRILEESSNYSAVITSFYSSYRSPFPGTKAVVEYLTSVADAATSSDSKGTGIHHHYREKIVLSLSLARPLLQRINAEEGLTMLDYNIAIL